MENQFKIITSPLFLLGLALLLLNDFYLKQAFGNWYTGKLSDVSGLFVFFLLSTVVFPKKKIACFIGTAMLFALWKSPLSNAPIGFLNNLGIPIGRTIDFTDLWAIAVLPFAYRYEKSSYTSFGIRPQIVIFVSAFAFVATTLPPKEEKKYVGINKTYEFNFSRNVLIDKLNRITAEKISKQRKVAEIEFDSTSDMFYTKWTRDTLAILLDSRKIRLNDTIRYETMLADFIIKGNDSISSITFINAYKVVSSFSDRDYKEKAIKEFEKEVIKKLK